MWVKICGLQTVDAAEEALERGADYLGVICVPKRKRTVSRDVARQISSIVHKRREEGSKCKLVGVFRNQSTQDIMRYYEDYGLDVVQLHGDEDVVKYRDEMPEEITIIKRFVFPRDSEDVKKSEGLKNVLALFDSDAGGTGEVLDWEAISEWSGNNPEIGFILAGGLNPSNVGGAIAQMEGIQGVDVSGGVETDGNKDFDKIRDFIANVKEIS